MGRGAGLFAPLPVAGGEAMIERDRLIVETLTSTEGAMGAGETWTSTGSPVWARVLPIGAMARATYKQLMGDVTREVRLKGRWTWTFGRFRFRWASRLENPQTRLIPAQPPLDPDGTGKYTVILCREEPPHEIPVIEEEEEEEEPGG